MALRSCVRSCWMPLSHESLALLAQHAPNLTSLSCNLTLTPNEPLILPAKLQSLELQMDGDTDAVINGVLTTLAALPSLSRLHLEHSVFNANNAVEFSRLVACPSLTDLTLGSAKYGFLPNFSLTQVDQMRSSLGHLRRLDLGPTNSDKLARLLTPPVTARWRDIGRVWADAQTGELLLRLPTLTKLDLRYVRDTAEVEFLPQLHHLTSLKFNCHVFGDGWSIPADALTSLLLCKGLTELDLRCGFKAAHWSALLATLSLRKITVDRGAVESLRCFASGPITQSLESLSIENIFLPPADVAHLYALRRLRTLRLDRCFSPRLNTVTLNSLTPPTALLPALTELSHRGQGQKKPDVRKGASFEWMQARLTQ